MTSNMYKRAALSLAALAVVLTPPPAWSQTGGGQPSTKLKKQIVVMERILDEVLVDSPNVLVGSKHVTHGLYLDEFGVLFSFEAALISHDFSRFFDKWDWSEFKVETEDGKTVIKLPGRDDDEDDDAEEAKNGKDKKKGPTPEERYDGVKTELIEALLDYGETLSGLRDGQWVAIALHFDDEEEIGDREITTLLIKAKVADLHAHGSDRLSKKDMEKRVVIDEY